MSLVGCCDSRADEGCNNSALHFVWVFGVVDYRKYRFSLYMGERVTIIRVRERRAKRVTVAQRPGVLGRARLSTYRSLVRRSATRADGTVLRRCLRYDSD